MASIINDKYKFIYIHIPKNGGTSVGGHHTQHHIKGALSDLEGNNVRPHVPASWFKAREDGKKWNEYYKFTFSRNPYTRVISLYNNFKRNITDKKYMPLYVDKFYKMVEGMSFEEFCLAIPYMIKEGNDLLQPQFFYFDFDMNVYNDIDFIGSYERLAQDLGFVMYWLGVEEPCGLKYHHRKSIDYDVDFITKFSKYFKSAEILDFVNTIYAKDFELFNYPVRDYVQKEKKE